MSGRQDVGFRRTFAHVFVCPVGASAPVPAKESLAKHLCKLIVSLRIVFDRSGASRLTWPIPWAKLRRVCQDNFTISQPARQGAGYMGYGYPLSSILYPLGR